jgi:predicted chitinase
MALAFLQDESEAEMANNQLEGCVVYLNDVAFDDKTKIGILKASGNKLQASFTTTDLTIKEIEIKLEIKKTDDKTPILYPANGWTKITPNKTTEISATTLPDGKYTLTFQYDKKTTVKTFFIRSKVYDFACTVCGRDLTVTKEKLDLIYPNGENITITLAGYFNTALKTAGFNTCKSHAHFFAQSYVETKGYTELSENPNYRYEGVLALHNQKDDAKLFFNQDFFDNNTHLDYFHFKVYKNLDDSTGNYTGQNYKTFNWKSSATDTVRVPSGGDAAYKFTKGKGTFNKVDFTKSEKISRNEQLLSIIYANQFENGTPSTKNGYTYRGQGAIHLTWKANYRLAITYAKDLFNEDFDWINHPEYLVNNEKDAVYSAVAYFYMRLKKDINKLNDWDINKVSYEVNGGNNGLPDRTTQFTRLSTQVFDLSDCKK